MNLPWIAFFLLLGRGVAYLWQRPGLSTSRTLDDLIGKSDFDFFGKMKVFDSEDDERLVLRTEKLLDPPVRAKRWLDGTMRWRFTATSAPDDGSRPA